jgi:hypothetical protein
VSCGRTTCGRRSMTWGLAHENVGFAVENVAFARESYDEALWKRPSGASG